MRRHQVHGQRTLGHVVAGMLATATLLLVLLGAPASAQDGEPVDADLAVDIVGDELTVTLEPRTTVVGALELDITGLPDLDGECEVVEGIGACQKTDGVLRVVALNPTGWEDRVLFARASFVESAATSDVQADLRLIADLQGDEITGAVAVSGATGGGGSNATAAIIIVGAIVAVAAIAALELRRRRSAGTTDRA